LKVVDVKENSKKSFLNKNVSQKNKKFFGKFLLKMIDQVK